MLDSNMLVHDTFVQKLDHKSKMKMNIHGYFVRKKGRPAGKCSNTRIGLSESSVRPGTCQRSMLRGEHGKSRVEGAPIHTAP